MGLREKMNGSLKWIITLGAPALVAFGGWIYAVNSHGTILEKHDVAIHENSRCITRNETLLQAIYQSVKRVEDKMMTK